MVPRTEVLVEDLEVDGDTTVDNLCYLGDLLVGRVGWGGYRGNSKRDGCLGEVSSAS